MPPRDRLLADRSAFGTLREMSLLSKLSHQHILSLDGVIRESDEKRSSTLTPHTYTPFTVLLLLSDEDVCVQ
jgi:hypothetical protein